MSSIGIFSLDVSLLGSQYNAKNGIGTNIYGPSTPSSSSQGPAVITPWAEDNGRSLLNRYNQLRTKTSFINENTSAVREAGLDKDDKALFTLYSALNDLKTIAEYAKDGTTSSSLIAGLSAQFRGGLAQVDDYLRQADLDKLILMAGDKKSYVTTSGVGKNDRDIQGLAVTAISGTSPILDLTGNEVFTINIKGSSTNQDDVIINLADIVGDVTLESVKNLINSKIGALTTVNGEGATVGKYKTRVSVEEVGSDRFGLTFNVDGIEELSFSAAISDPALIIASTTKSGDYGSTTEGALTKYTSLDGSGITKTNSTEIVGIDENGFVIPVDSSDEDAVETASETIKFETTPVAIQLDSQGNSFVVGTTEGDLGGQINGALTSDVFLSKFDTAGNLLWSRLLGASDEAEGFAIAIDADDNVIIGGKTNQELIASDVFSGTDSFVTKYSNSGEEIWTQQLDTISTDQANGLTTDASGNVYLTGQIKGQLNSTTTAVGGTDATIVKLSANTGTILSTDQFGTAGEDFGKEVAFASDGNLLVLSEEDGNAVIRKLDINDLTTTLAIYDLGDLAGGDATGLVVNGTDIYLTGSTSTDLLNGGPVTDAYSGGKDGFITKLSDDGASFSAQWTTFVGTSATDSIADITVQNGSVYVVGTTFGTFAGETKTGVTDGFTAKIDATTGSSLWQEQLGGVVGGYNESVGIAFSQNGSSVLDKLGLPTGTVNNTQNRDLTTQTSVRTGDHFYISINDGRDIKIDIRDGDTFNTIANRINTYSTRNLKATVTYGVDGPALRIEAKNGAEVDFKAGAEGRDALSKLGLEERSILSNETLFNLNKNKGIDPTDLGGVFALGLNDGFSFSNRKEAEYIFEQLDNAIKVIQSAHRSLTFNPLKAQLLQDAKANIGPAPAYLQDRLARYQDGLRRVLSVTGGSIY